MIIVAKWRKEKSCKGKSWSPCLQGCYSALVSISPVIHRKSGGHKSPYQFLLDRETHTTILYLFPAILIFHFRDRKLKIKPRETWS